MLLKRLFATLLTMAVLLYVPTTHAKIYRWVDANGITHFSDRAPKSGASQVVGQSSSTKKKKMEKAVAKPGVHKPKRPAVKKIQSKKLRKPVRVAKPKRTAKPKKTIKPRRVVKPARVVKPKRVPKSVKAAKPRQPPKPKQRRVEPRLVKKATKKPVKTPRPSTKSSHTIVAPVRVEKERGFAQISHAAAIQASLNATFYDLEMQPEFVPEAQQPKRKVILNVKKSLCIDKRMLLASLREKGFESYYDDDGEHRKAWGIEGFYRHSRRYLTHDEVMKKTNDVIYEVEQYCDQPYDPQLQANARADWIRSEYCEVSKVILEDLKHPFMRVSESDIEDQAEEVDRFCSERYSVENRDDERYFPKSLEVSKLQQKHFLYR